VFISISYRLGYKHKSLLLHSHYSLKTTDFHYLVCIDAKSCTVMLFSMFTYRIDGLDCYWYWWYNNYCNWAYHNNSDCIPGFQYYVKVFDDGDLMQSAMTIDNNHTFSELMGNITYTVVVQATVTNTGGSTSIMVTTNPSGLFATLDFKVLK